MAEYVDINHPNDLDEAIEAMKQICPESEETITRNAEVIILRAVKDGEFIKRNKFCDQVRDRMTTMIDPMSRKEEEITHKELYRAWIELWWWLDHYCEREPPKWVD